MASSNHLQKPKWKWLDDTNTWQPYDDETNDQIETAYNSTIICIKLNKGSYFGRYQNQIYTIVFDRSKYPIECKQRNNQTNSCRTLKREYKPPQQQQQQQSVLSSNTIHQITQQLINMSLNRKVVNKAFSIFNTKHNKNSNIITDNNKIINEIMEIIEQHQLTNMQNDDEKYDKQYQAQMNQDPYHSLYEVGDWIEVFANNVWIPAEITNTEPLSNTNVKGFVRAKMIHVEYEDTKTLQLTQIKLHGLHDKNKFRVLGTGFFSDSHVFNFEYTSNDNNKHKSSNAKHPRAYINRKCYKCKGKGIIYISNKQKKNNISKSRSCNKCNSSGTVNLKCNKCNNGIHKEAFSMQHDKCNGDGCDGCNDTGRFPLQQWKCKFCQGSAIFQVQCNMCNGSENKNNNKQKQQIISSDKIRKKCHKCISGYFLGNSKPISFAPKRDFDKRAHGQNPNTDVVRLYHATDKAGADGILETGLMFRGQSGSYGGGIYFTVKPALAKERARQSGYLVIANVYVGKCKEVSFIAPNMDFDTLNKMGYDSIKGTWSKQGVEYVVYCWDQVWVSVVVPFNKVDFSKLK